MSLSLQDWHQRFTQQAKWTFDLREYIYRNIEINKTQQIIEIGCGTGAILDELITSVPFQVGLDINQDHIKMAMRSNGFGSFVQGDANTLPFTQASFDVSFCHFLLLWIADPIHVISELCRITRPGGKVVAMAEPDYGGRIDFPPALAKLGKMQTDSLKAQGADPFIGRKIAKIFNQAGLQSVFTGVLGGQWSGTPRWDDWESEWHLLESDLLGKLEFSKELLLLKELDKSAYLRGERILFVPTFYAWGEVPSKA